MWGAKALSPLARSKMHQIHVPVRRKDTRISGGQAWETELEKVLVSVEKAFRKSFVELVSEIGRIHSSSALLVYVASVSVSKFAYLHFHSHHSRHSTAALPSL